MGKPFSFLQAVQDVTDFTDHELATLTGLARSTVNAYRLGRLPEYLDGRQIQALKRAAALRRDQMIQGCAELEMLA